MDFMDSVTKSKIIIAGIVWTVTIITWWYAIKKIPFRFLIQDTTIGLCLIIGILAILELVFRKYQLGGIIDTFNEWPSMWGGLILLILGGGTIMRYLNPLKIENPADSEEKK